MEKADNQTTDKGTKRRTFLRGAAVTSGAALLGTSAFGGTAAGRGRGNGDGKNGRGKPCHKPFECESDEGEYVKFEFDEEECRFVEETDTGLIEVTNWESKEGEECEPISVEWESEGYVVNKALAFGGNSCDGTEDEDGSGFDEGSYDSKLENNGGNTAAISNLQFCLEEIVEIPAESYIGYEDRPKTGDFDYNDFGMRASITETYANDELQEIEMEFSAEEYQAGDTHVISIHRDFLSDDTMEWEYELTRSGADDLTSSNTADETSNTTGSGSLNIALFDTEPLDSSVGKTSTIDATVSITVTITSGAESPPKDSPRPDVAANNPIFEVYDNIMNPDGISGTIDLGTVQDNVDKSQSNWDNVADVPNIIVVPDIDFDPPAESTTITAVYPEFDDYYADDNDDSGDTDEDLEVNDSLNDWFDTS